MIVDCGLYHEGRRIGGELTLEDAARAARSEGFTWLGLVDPDEDELSRMAKIFRLHELAVEDVRNAHQRPKLEDYEGTYFIVLRPARYVEATSDVELGEIEIFVAENHVIAVRTGPTASLAGVRRRLEERPDLLALGPAAVVWAIVDAVVDGYAPVAAELETDIEEVEESVFGGGDDESRTIHELRREVIELHRAVHPLLAPLEALERGAIPAIDDRLRSYFRDVADHARRADEEITALRELLNGVLQANLAMISTRQNEAVRKISGWAAIIAVPTFVASVYGMNFDHMPELEWRFGYPLTVGLMIAVAATLYVLLRRARWL